MEVIENDLIKSGLELIKSVELENENIQLSLDGDSGYGEIISLAIESPNYTDYQDFKKLIKSSEALIRSSTEYKMWISNLRNGCNINKCSFFCNLNTDNDCELEFHHTPLTLYDIVDIVLSHLLANNIPVTTTILADLVLDEHLRGNIGMMPVTVTAHKLIHANMLMENYKMIHGNWLSFMKKYKDGVAEIHISKAIEVMNRSDELVYQRASSILGSDYPQVSKYYIPFYDAGYREYIFEQLQLMN